MGYYVRKSLKAGPFRFNMSKSGLGVSTGIPGFRVGTGPRGNYVHVGEHGVYYRASLNPKRGPQPSVGSLARSATLPVSMDVAMEDMTGVTALDLTPTSSDDLVCQLNAAAKVRTRWPFLLLVPVLGWLAAPWVRLREHASRTVVVFYQVEGADDQWFERFVNSWTALSHSVGLWRLTASGDVTTASQFKENSGASTVISRLRAAASLTGPSRLVTNIVVPTVSTGDQSIYFLPDRIIVSAGKRFSDIAYGALQAAFEPTRFIETGGVPQDSRQIDTTWEHPNVKGGPDKRYKTNRVLPIMEYGKMTMWTQSGLSWTLECSNAKASEDTVRALRDARAPGIAKTS